CTKEPRRLHPAHTPLQRCTTAAAQGTLRPMRLPRRHGRPVKHPRPAPCSARWARCVILGSAVLGACACGGTGTPRQGSSGAVQQHEVTGAIALYADDYRVRGYDEDDARLQRVRSELERIYGRPIVVRFHVETMPRAEGFFEHFLNEELGKVPRIMGGWKKHHPEAFAEMTAELR